MEEERLDELTEKVAATFEKPAGLTVYGNSKTIGSYGSASWDLTDVTISDNTLISGTFKTSGTWSFVPPPRIEDRIWDAMFALNNGDLKLSLEEMDRLIAAIAIHGEVLGKLNFILYGRD